MTEVRRRIDQVTANINDTYAAVEAAGGAVPAAKTSDNLPSTVANALANAGEDLDAVLEEQAALISQITAALDGKAAGGGGGSGLETCTVELTQDGSGIYIASVQVVDGAAAPYYIDQTMNNWTWQAPSGSLIVIACDLNLTTELDKMTYVGDGHEFADLIPNGFGPGGVEYSKVYRIDAGAGETARIYLEEIF